jgi:hypothetical protein
MRANRWQKLLSKSFTRSAHSINEKNVNRRQQRTQRGGYRLGREMAEGASALAIGLVLHQATPPPKSNFTVLNSCNSCNS